MKKRQIIIIAVALAILALGVFMNKWLGEGKEKQIKKPKNNVTTVFTDKVVNDSIPVFIKSTGVLKARKRIEIFSEVQGVMELNNNLFKAGNTFKKGDLLISIRSNDQEAQLYAQRSSFESLLTSILPDLKVDFKEEFKLWEDYLNDYSTTKTINELPEVQSAKLKSFLVGRGIYSNYHSLKNLEIINSKYKIRAAYDGILISANVDPGTVIRQGQSLGVFIQPNHYEMETAVNAVSAERLSIGQNVELSMQGLPEKRWQGKIIRLVKAIDAGSQMSTFFVAVSGEDLKEGMFMQAKVEAKKISKAYEISRSALVDNNKVYLVQADTLVTKRIKSEYLGQNTAIISGLNNGDQVLVKVPPSAFSGMKVSVYQDRN